MIYSPFLVISLPLICSCLLAFFIYETNENFFNKTFMLFFILVLLTLFMESILRLLKIKVIINASDFIKQRVQNNSALMFGFFIFIFCMVDLYLRGPLLFTAPDTYYIFTPEEKFIRYVTIMCWVLIPIAFFCTNNKIIRTVFISTAFLFPIIAVDRNRLFSSFYVLLITFFICNKEKLNKEFIYKNIIKIVSFIIVILTCFVLIFSFVGSKRGSLQQLFLLDQKQLLSDKIEKYERLKHINVGDIQIINLNNALVSSSGPLLWFLVYPSASIFNFSVVYNIDYQDPDYLNYQVFRMFNSDTPKQIADLTPLPFPIKNLTVGTEFLPFLLYGGTTGVLFSFLVLCSIYILYVLLLAKYPNSIFLLLGFLKLSYCCIMLGFAPQFFTFTNIGFLMLMISLHIASKSHFLIEYAVRFKTIYTKIA